MNASCATFLVDKSQFSADLMIDYETEETPVLNIITDKSSIIPTIKICKNFIFVFDRAQDLIEAIENVTIKNKAETKQAVILNSKNFMDSFKILNENLFDNSRKCFLKKEGFFYHSFCLQLWIFW